MLSRELDQFYTKKEVAIDCYNKVSKLINLEKYKLIEPSAGEGRFSDLFHSNSMALDLDPKKSYIEKMDFFDFNYNSDDPVVVIGNPPFGKNSSLAIKFFNKSALFSDYICMILPKTFKKDSVKNKLDLNFHLKKEWVLSKNSFTFNDNEYDVPCVFQIWEKREVKRKIKKQKSTSKLFDFTDELNADVAVRRVGGLAGKVLIDFNGYKESSHYYIKFKEENKDSVLNVFINSYKELNNKARNTAGNPSLSKHELITIIEKEYKKI